MANGSRHSLYVTPEVTYGTTPNNPPLSLVRITGTTLGLAKDSLQSEEIRSDRQIADFRLGANQVGGDINFELSYGSFDDLLQAVLLSTPWAPAADTGVTTISASATGYTQGSGDFVASGFAVGQIVDVLGFAGAGANGRMKITAVTPLTMDTTPLDGQTQGVEAGDGDEQIVASDIIKAGSTRASFTFVRNFADLAAIDNPFYIYRGVELTSTQLTIAANSMVTGTFTVVGQSQTTEQDLTVLGVPTFPPASTTSPLDSFTGSLLEGGVSIAVITEISLTLQNGIEPRFVVGSKNSIYPSVGRSNLSGQVTAYFEDSTLVNKFLNETESSIQFELPDGAGNIQTYTIPRLKYTGGQPDVAGEGPITLTMPFQALLDSTTGTNIIIERAPV